jgi:hypothetical protein
LAGTSFVALEERLLLAAQPFVEVAGGNAPIGGEAQFTLTFDNTAAPGAGNIGYAPFIDLVLPRRGVDGEAPGTGPNQTYDGLEFFSASYLGVQLKATKLVFDANGNATHPFLRVENTDTPLVVSANTFKLDGVGHPNARAGAGDQLIVLELPFGSFAPEQPKVTVNVTAKVSSFADQNAPLPVVARGGFAFGNDALDNPITDRPFVGAVASNTVTPSVLTVSKTYDGKENETATGPNFARTFTIRLDVVTGQTVSAISLVDRLPDGIVVSGTPTLSVLGVSVPPTDTGAPKYIPENHTVTATINQSLLGVAGAEVTMTVPFYVRDMLAPGSPANPVLDPLTGAPRDLHNHVRAEANWLPLDPRDRNPGNLPIRIELDPDRVEATVTAKSIATQKSQIILNDLAPTGLGPNDIIRYTVDVQVSDYFRLGSVVLTDKLSDGQAFLPESARLRVIEGGTVLGSMDILDPVNLFNTGNPSITPPPEPLMAKPPSPSTSRPNSSAAALTGFCSVGVSYRIPPAARRCSSSMMLWSSGVTSARPSHSPAS